MSGNHKIVTIAPNKNRIDRERIGNSMLGISKNNYNTRPTKYKQNQAKIRRCKVDAPTKIE